MNPFTSIDIAPSYYPCRIVLWTIDPTFSEAGPYSFTVEGSEDPAFKEINVSLPVGDSYFAQDDTRTIQSFASRFVYRVKLETANNTYYSPSVFYDGGKEESRKYLYAAEIVRKDLLRTRVTGRPGWLLKKKNYSILIAEELDPVSGVPISDNSSSYGSRYEAGYYAPLHLVYTTENHSDDIKLSEDGSGVTHRKIATFRFVGFPSVEVRDVVVADSGERYSVVKNQTRYYPGSSIVLTQTCSVTAIPNTDPVYQIEVGHV